MFQSSIDPEFLSTHVFVIIRFLQQIGKNGVAANARGCLHVYVQHLITTKKVVI